jgi:hypothetical protein
MKQILLVAMLTIGAATRSSEPSVPVTIPTAEDGDQVVQFNAITKMPMQVSDGKVEIIGTNISFEAKPGDTTKIHWGWTFTARFKGTSVPVSILVEDETKAPMTIAYQSDAPRLQEGGGWAGIGPAKPISKQFISFLDSGQPLFRVFRFTIKYQDGTTSRLHQASVHDPVTLKRMIALVAETLP